MKKRRVIIGGLLIAIFIGFGAWAFGFFHREDPQIAKLKELSSQAWDQSLPEAQRNQARGDLRQGIGALNDDQRRQFFDSNRDQWMKGAQQRMDEFFAMSKADQQKRLDEIINRMVQAQKSSQQNGNRQAGAGRNRGANMSDASREARSQRRLDRTSPSQRAQFTEFRKRLDERATQHGIKLPDPRGGGFGGFGRGMRGA